MKSDKRPTLLGILASVLFSAATVQAQILPTIQWQKSFGGSSSDYAQVVKQTSDGGYLLGGYSSSLVSGNKTNQSIANEDYWVVKVDCSGNKQWERTYGGNSDDELYCLQQTSDQGYIFGGYSRSYASGNKTSSLLGSYDYWVVKADSEGNIQWDRSFGGTDVDVLYSLQQTSDGGYALGGVSRSGASGNKTNASFGFNDYWLVKLDANGNKQWDQCFGGTNDDQLTSLQQTSDGGFILGGSSNSGLSGNKTNDGFGKYDYWIVKVDESGNKQWDKSFGGSGDDQLQSLQQTSDGGYVLGGYSYSGISGNKTSGNWGQSDYWVVKLDADGNKQWDKSFGGTNFINDCCNSGYDELQSLQQTRDGGYLLGGTSVSGVSGNKTSASFGSSDYWLVKIDPNGNKQWEQSFGGSSGDWLTSLQQTSDGGYVLGGYSTSSASGIKTSPGFGSTDYWLVKLSMPLSLNSSSFNSNGIFHTQLSGAAGTNYIFLASSNLTDWVPLLTNNAADGLVNFSDTNTAGFLKRFYRVQQQP